MKGELSIYNHWPVFSFLTTSHVWLRNSFSAEPVPTLNLSLQNGGQFGSKLSIYLEDHDPDDFLTASRSAHKKIPAFLLPKWSQ